MQRNQQAEESLRTLHDIRGIMERSTRFLSLSGWSGVWAGCTALAAALLAGKFISASGAMDNVAGGYDIPGTQIFTDPLTIRLCVLGLVTFAMALCGALFFTWSKAKAAGQKLWNPASRQLMWHVIVPMTCGGIFVCAFLFYGALLFIVPACLAFYGLALINGSKYTLGEIRWLGYCEVILGCICLLLPGYGLYFMAAGFGVLHILYGAIMWNKYDKHRAA